METTQSLAESVDSAYRQAFYAQPNVEFEHRWLAIAASRLNAKSGVLLTDPGQPPVAQWPIAGALPPPSYMPSAGQVWQTGQGAVSEMGPGRYLLMCPATWQGSVYAVAVFELALGQANELPLRLDEAQWAAGWLVLGRLQNDIQTLEQGSRIQAGALELMAEVLAEPRLELAIRALLARVSRLFDVDRASFAWMQGRKVALRYVSDMANPKKRQESLQRIKAAMAESADQNSWIATPAIEGEDRLIDRAHRALVNEQGGSSSLTGDTAR